MIGELNENGFAQFFGGKKAIKTDKHDWQAQSDNLKYVQYLSICFEHKSYDAINELSSSERILELL